MWRGERGRRQVYPSQGRPHLIIIILCVCVFADQVNNKGKKMCAAAGRGRGSRRAGGQIGRILDQRQGLISPLGPCYCACCSAGYPCSLVGFIEPNLSAPRSQPPTSPINDPSTAPASLGGVELGRGAHTMPQKQKAWPGPSREACGAKMPD